MFDFGRRGLAAAARGPGGGGGQPGPDLAELRASARAIMALVLLVAGGERRWRVTAGIPTTLRESQLVLAGSLPPGSAPARGAARDPSISLPAVDDDGDVATIERIGSGWQLTRHSPHVQISVSRAFGGHVALLPSPGSVALLCHSDTIRFSTAASPGSAASPGGGATLTVELPRTDDISSGEESEELCDDPPETAGRSDDDGGGQGSWDGAAAPVAPPTSSCPARLVHVLPAWPLSSSLETAVFSTENCTETDQF